MESRLETILGTLTSRPLSASSDYRRIRLLRQVDFGPPQETVLSRTNRNSKYYRYSSWDINPESDQLRNSPRIHRRQMVLDYSPSSPPVVEGIYDQRKLPCFRKQKVWWTTDVVTRFPSVLGRESPGIMSPSGSLDQELKEDSRYFMGVDLFFCSTLGSKCGVLRTAVVRVLRRRVL